MLLQMALEVAVATRGFRETAEFTTFAELSTLSFHDGSARDRVRWTAMISEKTIPLQ